MGLYSSATGRCGCAINSFEVDSTFKSAKTFCKCSLAKSKKECQDDGQWHVMSVSNVIELIDSEVGRVHQRLLNVEYNRAFSFVHRLGNRSS